MNKLGKDDRKMLGRHGEELAFGYLQEQEYQIIERNWRCRSGEIDIIAEKSNKLIFIEVRTRRPSKRFGTAKESVDYRKQAKVREIAQFYMHRFHKYEQSIQFDVIAVEMSESNTDPKIIHIQEAF
ncbi:YraN family protein [Paenibacillus qinlingensis]|uniref:YraN family protein n=1 Tax=Paenibacillus qinlingensis TaxID=1837343 RepID=UPI0015676398|nr:YraN family protein [Paenibacillus qinlingensis]NQX57409.1 YraN family protein [Paenibacillus qinlingensis]